MDVVLPEYMLYYAIKALEMYERRPKVCEMPQGELSTEVTVQNKVQDLKLPTFICPHIDIVMFF